jgi:hypothetical protein
MIRTGIEWLLGIFIAKAWKWILLVLLIFLFISLWVLDLINIGPSWVQNLPLGPVDSAQVIDTDGDNVSDADDYAPDDVNIQTEADVTATAEVAETATAEAEAAMTATAEAQASAATPTVEATSTQAPTATPSPEPTALMATVPTSTPEPATAPTATLEPEPTPLPTMLMPTAAPIATVDMIGCIPLDGKTPTPMPREQCVPVIMPQTADEVRQLLKLTDDIVVQGSPSGGWVFEKKGGGEFDLPLTEGVCVDFDPRYEYLESNRQDMLDQGSYKHPALIDEFDKKRVVMIRADTLKHISIATVRWTGC